MTRLIEPSEREFQTALLELAAINGWRFVHFRPGMNRRGQWSTPLQGDAGFPDVVLVRPPRVIFAELKSSSGKATDGQKVWIETLGRCPGIETYLFRPDDWDRIAELLSRRSAA